MAPRDMTWARLRRAFVACAVVLSLVLAALGAQPRAADPLLRSAMIVVGAVQAPDQIATLAASAKSHRPSDLRPGTDPDPLPLSTRPDTGPAPAAARACSCEPRAPTGPSLWHLPEPRAPPSA